MDKHGNINAAEGCDRCVCGCKYWENDKCVDCGTLIEIAKIHDLADRVRLGNEIKLNVMFATMTHYDLPWLTDAPITDLTDIMAKYRAAGTIK